MAMYQYDYKIGPVKLDKAEMSNIIYDTLFRNTQWPQFNPELVTPLYSRYEPELAEYNTQEVDARKGIIRFGYAGKEFELTVKEITE